MNKAGVKIMSMAILIITSVVVMIFAYFSYMACEENQRLKKTYELFSVPSSYPKHSYNEIFYTFCRDFKKIELPPEFQKQKSHQNQTGEKK